MRCQLGILLLAFVSLSTLFVSLGVDARYSYVKGPVSKEEFFDKKLHRKLGCPGHYCGRSDLNETHLSECGQCERGWRVGKSGTNTSSYCEKCDSGPGKNDILFMAFHFVTVLVLQWVAIDYAARRRKLTYQVLALHFSALVEVSLAAIVTVLSLEPVGEMTLRSCRVDRVLDWYTYFQNPNPNYEETLHCTQEAVYPLYTMVFIFHAMCVIFMVISRPFLSAKLLPQRGRNAIYAALYFLPGLSIIHATVGGIVHAIYQYVILISSVISLAFHFAHQLDQSPRALLIGCFKEPRSLVILLGHWVLHGFGIMAVTQCEVPERDLPFLALVPLPAVFYIGTAKFTGFP